MIKSLRFIGAFFFLFSIAGMINGCRADSQNEVKDIFREDENSNRRRQANTDDLLWTIKMNGCTGSLLSPDYMLTANHCGPRAGERYTSGSALKNGGRSDITVEQVVESSQRLDFAILKIRWNGTRPADQRFPPKIATSPSDLSMGRGSNQGDELFAVGFPADKQLRATYSEGRAKEVRGSDLRYNVGIINGNSGGAVWRKNDNMLVSLTSGGPNAFNQGSWRGSSKDDANHWNHGAAIWIVYSNSRVLKDIFPDGNNRFVEPGEGDDDPIGKDLFVAIEDQNLWSATGADADQVIVCIGGEVANCTTSANDGTMVYKNSQNGRKLFKIDQDMAFSDKMDLTFVSFDSNGKRLSAIKIQLNEKG
jgi:V8-like Glu-specific endopeptidase